MFSGFLNIHKPLGITSHDVVNNVRRLTIRDFQSKKVGHAGTLDPLAEGVLIVCVGDATRLSDYVMHQTKVYRAKIHLGIETETYDAEGQIVSSVDATHVSCDAIEKALRAFVGDIQQVPPIYSAIKKDGKKLYELARAGQEVVVEPRSVHIERITLLSFESPFVTIDIECGAGTYIRSLAHDLGAALGVGAHLAALIRTRSGQFDVENAVMLDVLAASEQWTNYIIAPYIALEAYPQFIVTEEQARELSFGRAIPIQQSDIETCMVYLSDHQLIAVASIEDNLLKPQKVFAHGTH